MQLIHDDFLYVGTNFLNITNSMAWNTEVQCRIQKAFSNNAYPETYQPNSRLIHISLGSSLILSFHLRLGLPNALFPVGLPVKIFKVLLPNSLYIC